jgi:hypothetical protein
MVHDVIHERYPKYGPAHYRERNRLTREKLAALARTTRRPYPWPTTSRPGWSGSGSRTRRSR